MKVVRMLHLLDSHSLQVIAQELSHALCTLRLSNVYDLSSVSLLCLSFGDVVEFPQSVSFCSNLRNPSRVRLL